MSNWISKATGAFKGDDSSSPQAFELTCECGQKHSGMRRAKWQRIICRSCGGPLFVMQRDPYPIPKELPQQSSARAGFQEAEVAVAVEAEHRSPASAPSRGRRESDNVVGAPKRFVPSTVQAPARSLRASQSRFWKQFRIILFVIGCVGLGTGYVVYRSAQRSAAEQSLKDSIDKIRDAFQRSEWVEARNQLEIAVRSLDYLGREGPGTKRYRQQLRETTAMTGLITQPLSELLDDAAKAESEGQDALENFQYRVKGQWLILDGQAKPELSESKSTLKSYLIPLPLSVGEKNLSVDIVVESTEFARMMAKSEAESVVVAVQVDAIELNEGKSNWRIMTRPESTVLWSDRTTYQGIGFTSEETDSLASVLSKQAASLGITGESDAP